MLWKEIKNMWTCKNCGFKNEDNCLNCMGCAEDREENIKPNRYFKDIQMWILDFVRKIGKKIKDLLWFVFVDNGIVQCLVKFFFDKIETLISTQSMTVITNQFVGRSCKMGIRLDTLGKWKRQDERAYRKATGFLLVIGLLFGCAMGVILGWQLAMVFSQD